MSELEPQVMVALLNRQHVVFDMFREARGYIAHELQIDPASVTIEVARGDDNTAIPRAVVVAPHLLESKINDVCTKAMNLTTRLIQEQLNDIGSRRP